jgi:hypothetical protein
MKVHHRYQPHRRQICGVNYTGGKFAVSTTLVVNFPPVATTPAAKFSTGTACVVDTGGKFAASERHQRQITGTISDCWHLKS